MSDPSPPTPPTPPTPPPPPIPQPPDPGAGRAQLEADLAREFPRATPRRRLATGLVVFVVIAALVLSLVMVRRVSSGDEAGSGGDPPPTTQPEPATEAEIEEAVAEISDFVASERELDFVNPVQVELEGEGDFQDRLLADFDEDADQLRNTEVFLEGLGLVDPGTDLVESMRSLLGVGVVGFYDPETDELVVRGAALTPYVRTTIAHELVHALDDQHLDLDRPEYDEADDEIGFGFSAIVEGNARRVENAYRASLSDEERTRPPRRSCRWAARPISATSRWCSSTSSAPRTRSASRSSPTWRPRVARRRSTPPSAIRPARASRCSTPSGTRAASRRSRCPTRPFPARSSRRGCWASCWCCSSWPTASTREVARTAATGGAATGAWRGATASGRA